MANPLIDPADPKEPPGKYPLSEEDLHRVPRQDNYVGLGIGAFGLVVLVLLFAFAWWNAPSRQNTAQIQPPVEQQQAIPKQSY